MPKFAQVQAKLARAHPQYQEWASFDAPQVLLALLLHQWHAEADKLVEVYGAYVPRVAVVVSCARPVTEVATPFKKCAYSLVTSKAV